MRKTICIVLAALLAAITLSGQSKSFKLGQWVEIRNGILKELNRSYVDSLPLDRIQRVSIDAMLDDLDPYTQYIPEEDEEDLEMLLSKSYGGFGAVIYKPDKESNVIVNEPYKGSPADKLGFRCGDEITAIDGVPVQGLTAAECTTKMKGKPGTSVVFTVKKVYTGEVKDVTVVRERIKLPDVEYAGMLEDGTTGYILQSGFTEGVAADHVGGGEAFGAEGGCDRVQEDGGLGHAGGAEVLVAAFEHHVREAEAEYLVGALHQFACLFVGVIKVLAHSRELRSLAGENICSLHSVCVFQIPFGLRRKFTKKAYICSPYGNAPVV